MDSKHFSLSALLIEWTKCSTVHPISGKSEHKERTILFGSLSHQPTLIPCNPGPGSIRFKLTQIPSCLLAARTLIFAFSSRKSPRAGKVNTSSPLQNCAWVWVDCGRGVGGDFRGRGAWVGIFLALRRKRRLRDKSKILLPQCCCCFLFDAIIINKYYAVHELFFLLVCVDKSCCAFTIKSNQMENSFFRSIFWDSHFRPWIVCARR